MARDLLNTDARRAWADHLDKEGVQYAFFSAANAAALLEAKRQFADVAESDDVRSRSSEESESTPSTPNEDDTSEEGSQRHPSQHHSREEDSEDEASEVEDIPTEEIQDPRTRVLTVLELESLFLQAAPPLECKSYMILSTNSN